MRFLTVASIVFFLIIAGCGDSSPTTPAPSISAMAGTWTGETVQQLPISFVVIQSPDSLGYLQVVIDVAISDDPDTFTWTLSKNYPYSSETGDWSMDATTTDPYNNIHTISIEGTFTETDECSGTLSFASPTYHGGYDFKNKTFSVFR